MEIDKSIIDKYSSFGFMVIFADNITADEIFNFIEHIPLLRVYSFYYGLEITKTTIDKIRQYSASDEFRNNMCHHFINYFKSIINIQQNYGDEKLSKWDNFLSILHKGFGSINGKDVYTTNALIKLCDYLHKMIYNKDNLKNKEEFKDAKRRQGEIFFRLMVTEKKEKIIKQTRLSYYDTIKGMEDPLRYIQYLNLINNSLSNSENPTEIFATNQEEDDENIMYRNYSFAMIRLLRQPSPFKFYIYKRIIHSKMLSSKTRARIINDIGFNLINNKPYDKYFDFFDDLFDKKDKENNGTENGLILVHFVYLFNISVSIMHNLNEDERKNYSLKNVYEKSRNSNTNYFEELINRYEIEINSEFITIKQYKKVFKTCDLLNILNKPLSEEIKTYNF